MTPVKETLTLAAGALLFLWPALLNGYPLLFSDTAAFLGQVPVPDYNWDKPFVYGPLLLLFHGNTTLWTPAVAQAALLSAVLRLAGTVFALTRPRHLGACAVLAAASAAPWFASTLMPDIFAPVAVLSLFTLAYAPRRFHRALAAGIATLAVAVHLAHLVLAAACITVLLLLRRRRALPTLAPLGAALLLVLTLNAAGEREWGISPYGSIFLLARLVADGPARTTLAERCPAAPGWRLCRWTAWLDDDPDSDRFLWDGHGPVWDPGPTALRDEAGEVVRATLLAHPLAVARAMAANTAAQLTRVAVGDTLVATHLDATVGKALATWFPRTEQARYAAALQPRGLLTPDPWTLPHLPALVLGLLLTLAVAVRGPPPSRALALLVLAALVANAFGTGALSAPHDRYGARIAWLLLVPALLYPTRSRTASAPIRTSAS